MTESRLIRGTLATAAALWLLMFALGYGGTVYAQGLAGVTLAGAVTAWALNALDRRR